MNVAELKNDLIRIIINTDDVNFLEKAKDFFKKNQATTDWWDEISDYEKAMFEQGKKDLENGNHIPYQEVKDEISKILQKN